MRLDAVIEGRCPNCSGALQRREHDGWCNACNCGWAYKTTGPGEGELSLTIEPTAVELRTSFAGSPRIRSTGHRVTVSRAVDIGDAGAPSVNADQAGQASGGLGREQQ